MVTHNLDWFKHSRDVGGGVGGVSFVLMQS